MKRLALFCMLASAVSFSAAVAQQPKAVPSPIKAFTSGNFDIAMGEVVELTHEKILLRFDRGAAKPDSIRIAIGGRGFFIKLGAGMNLAGQSRGHERGRRGGRSQNSQGGVAESCYIDLLRVLTPTGLPPIATFRLTC